MNSIFINYRIDDTSGYAGRLHDELCVHFDKTEVFYDKRIQGGSYWSRDIENALDQCCVLLSLIGSRWQTPRLNDPADYVRREIATAIRRGVRIIPVLLQKSSLPRKENLPSDITGLLDRQGVEILDEDWLNGVLRLLDSIEATNGIPKPKKFGGWGIYLSCGLYPMVGQKWRR